MTIHWASSVSNHGEHFPLTIWNGDRHRQTHLLLSPNSKEEALVFGEMLATPQQIVLSMLTMLPFVSTTRTTTPLESSS
jgi:hypothetical protein